MPSKINGKELYHLKTPGNQFAVLVFTAGAYQIGDQIFGQKASIQRELERLSREFDDATTSV